jgi:hypothetical protein
VAWILHISDPHLGDVSPGQELDDEKVLLERQRDRETTQRVFLRTLGALKWFIERHGRPDAAVVSGDLTYQARKVGFDAFVTLLKEHADVLPEKRRRIAVVPGNHDVVWDEPPGSVGRYAGFNAATRAKGCATPLLDEIDFHGDGGVLDADIDKYPHLVTTDDFVIVPINSSNYCGALVDLPKAWTGKEWEAKLAPLGDETSAAVAQLKRLRQHDMARVSRAQIEAIGRLFDRSSVSRERLDDGRVRIAVIHHQLLPVSTREERKTFESLVNLGLVRQTLREFGFDVVLHGHKHETGLYWDYVRLESDPIEAPSRRMLVIASPGHFDVGQPAMRALMLEGNARARNLRIATFCGAGPHTKKAQIAAGEARAPLWVGPMESETVERIVVRGRNAHTVYARLRALFELRDFNPLHNIVCELDGADDAEKLSPDYPDVPASDAQSWFTDLVAWWQLERSELVARGILPFNHGERIYRRWDDQVERAARMLDERDDSSRALIELISPRETGRHIGDTRDLHRGSYPAFALAEFSLVSRGAQRELDCFGYFRKQEMQYWWPVNVAELRTLQKRVVEAMKTPSRAGRVVTFSAIAEWDQQLRGVAVPEIDRLIEHPERLWQMAAAVAFRDTATSAARQDWRQVLNELSGEGRTEPPRPAIGHTLLLEELKRFEQLNSSSQLSGVIRSLNELAERYEAFQNQDLNQAAVNMIRKAVKALADAVGNALNDRA